MKFDLFLDHENIAVSQIVIIQEISDMTPAARPTLANFYVHVPLTNSFLSVFSISW